MINSILVDTKLIESRKNMDLVIKQLQYRSTNHILKFYKYEFIENDLCITYFESNTQGRYILFKDILSKEGIERYSKLYRFGKEDYLNYTTYIEYYDEFSCDICDDDGLTGQRFKCIKCFEIDICHDCYYSNNKKLCPTCGSDKLFKYAEDHIYPRASKVII